MAPKISDMINPDGSRNVKLTGSIQQTIQTHNAVSVPGNTANNSPVWIDTVGFSEIGVTLLNDGLSASYVNLVWSNDGLGTQHGTDVQVTPGSQNTTVSAKAGSVPVKARYVKLQVVNGDAAAHTFSAWVYLKA